MHVWIFIRKVCFTFLLMFLDVINVYVIFINLMINKMLSIYYIENIIDNI